MSRDTEAPTGPPPAFEETLLQRQARVALDPPDVPDEPAPAETTESPQNEYEITVASDTIEPPPTPSERAEASFAETRGLAGNRDAPTVNLSA